MRQADSFHRVSAATAADFWSRGIDARVASTSALAEGEVALDKGTLARDVRTRALDKGTLARKVRTHALNKGRLALKLRTCALNQ